MIITPEEEFEFLKKTYILKSDAHAKALEQISFDDVQKIGTVADIAMIHADVATSYMDLCKFILQFHDQPQ